MRSDNSPYKSHFKAVFSVFIVAILAVLRAAPPIAGAEEKMTLPDAYRLALGNHESIAIAREQLIQSQKTKSMAYSFILPKLSASGRYRKFTEKQTSPNGTSLLQPDSTTNLEVKLEQLLYGGGRSLSGIRQAKKGESASRIAVEYANELVIIQTARDFYGALRSAREVEIKEASLKRAEQQQRVSRARLRAGTATKTLVLRADAEAAGITAELFSARAELKNAIWRLGRITGAVATEIVVYPPPEEELPELKVEELVALALEKRRDYRILDLEREMAYHGVRYARGGFLPTVTLEGIYINRDQSPTTVLFVEESIYGGVNVSVPIFEGGLKRAELGEAKSKLKEAELEKLSLRRDIEIEVREAYNNVETLSYIIESFSKQNLFAKENYDMVFKQFSYGILDNLDVIDADATLVAAELGLMNAKYDHQLGLLELKRSAGVLLSEVGDVVKGASAK
ncbi:MAG: TolC family protein [Thermodesulfobacteriota bacterium]